MKKIIYTLTLLCLSSVFGAKPTADSLFQNLNNVDVKDKTVIASYSIKKNSELGEHYFLNKFLFEKKKGSFSQLCQVNFANGVVSKSNIDELKCFTRKNLLVDLTQEQKIFYSLLDILLQNSSEMMLKTLRGLGSSIKSNNELINKTKNFYLHQKKQYLQSKKDGSQEVENPLVSDDPEKNERIKKTLSESYLKQDNLVRRVKNGRDFYWKVEDQAFNATFDHLKNRLIKLVIKTEQGNYKVLFKNYISVNNLFEHPESIEVTDPNNTIYTMSIKSVQLVEDRAGSFNKRIKLYKKKMMQTDGESSLKLNLIK